MVVGLGPWGRRRKINPLVIPLVITSPQPQRPQSYVHTSNYMSYLLVFPHTPKIFLSNLPSTKSQKMFFYLSNTTRFWKRKESCFAMNGPFGSTRRKGLGTHLEWSTKRKRKWYWLLFIMIDYEMDMKNMGDICQAIGIWRHIGG